MALTGPGGIGKTQLALELAYRAREELKSCLVFWISASDRESVYQSFTHIARRLNIPGWDDEKADVKKLVQLHLSQESVGKWLLIVDNIDETGLEPTGSSKAIGLIEFLPSSGRGAIIFTTTDRNTAVALAGQQIIDVPEMEQNMARRMLELFLVNKTNEQETADLLLKELAYLPLAIGQAAAYVNVNKITLQQYLSLLVEQKEELVKPLRRESNNVIAATWLISFERIRRYDALAADYLLFMACIDRSDIPLALLPAVSPYEKGRHAVETLNSYSFVTKRIAESSLDLHRLVHGSTRSWLQKKGLLIQQTQVAITRLAEVYPDHSHRNRSRWRRLLPHAKFALLTSPTEQENGVRVDLVWKCAMTLHSDGRWKEAEELFVQVIETKKRVLREEHPDTLASMANLASTYINQGRWKEAEELQAKQLGICSRVLGEEHPDTLVSMANLASVYRNQGRWKEAEELFVQVIETRKRVLGEEHPSTLTSMNNLASTFQNQCRWKEAEELQAKQLGICSRVLGEEHPDTLTSIDNLASTFRNQGRWKEAEELEVQVIETFKRVLGEEHPDTLTSMANLASTFQNQGRWKEAEELEVQVMETKKRVLGEEHPDTLTSVNNLALTFQNQCRWKEAEELRAKQLGICSRVLGEEHPDTLTSMASLASTYRNQYRWKEAEELEVQVIETFKRVLGEEHPSTLMAIGSLAFTLKS